MARGPALPSGRIDVLTAGDRLWLTIVVSRWWLRSAWCKAACISAEIQVPGWPSRGEPVGAAVPSAEHAMRYFAETQQWGRREGIKLFWFASFDEPWKRKQEGEVGTQWGLWGADERLKYGSDRA